MIKDKLTEAVEAGLENIKKGDDHIPLNMRGELEVIVKDRDGNVISYERGHNQVTNLAKMAIIHLLAGEVGVIDSKVYSMPESTSESAVTLQRVYALETSSPEDPKAEIVSSFNPSNHSTTQNLDGQLVSGEQFFYNGATYASEDVSQLSQVLPKDVSGSSLKFNFPTKMLFGTGMEAYNAASMNSEYATEINTTETTDLSTATILRLNGVAQGNTIPDNFWSGCSSSGDGIASSATKLSNWYSNSKFRCRTLQPSTPSAMAAVPNAADTSIKGAIKNCFITTTGDASKYNATTKMAYPEYRGYGYPCFIYAKRSTEKFYEAEENNHETYYERNAALGSVPYETEITYTVDMPAQPVNSNEVTTFYPYNGWILKQAGLFSDSRFRIRSEDLSGSSQLSERVLLEKTNDSLRSDDARAYRDSVGGQLLFTRNLSSPILKTADNEISFIWHIFITI